MATAVSTQTLFRKHIALPQDHGSWVFLFSPLLIGLFAGRSWTGVSALLIVAALAAFLARQPVTVMVKVYSKRRPPRELSPALFWTAVYGLIGLASLGGLVALGHGDLLYLALPGLPVFAWHLVLVSRRAERRQMGVELVASGVLALAAPAGLWVGLGYPAPVGWLLWALAWLQSAASIVYAYLRLGQREWKALPPVPGRLREASRALGYSTFNLALAAALALLNVVPPLLTLPYVLQWAETVWGALRPAIGYKPTRIGIRQLIVSSLFTLLFILAWNLS